VVLEEDFDARLYQKNPVCRMIGALNEIDDQGFKWGRIRFSRDEYRKERIENFHSHRSHEQVLNKKTSTKEEGGVGDAGEVTKTQFYRHRYTKRETRVSAGHF
jgi:hypothetical protein